MLSFFLCFRAAIFALFIICNAIICSVASWNLSFVQENARVANVDGFLIFIGASGLIVIFPVIFVELVRKGAVVSKVWFEATWLTFFWVLNTVGAITATAITSHDLCGFSSAETHNSGSACASARILVVFTWLNTAFVLLYSVLLTIFAMLHQREDPPVWKSSVCEFPWFGTKQCLRSIPSSPVMSRFSRAKSPSLVIPKPYRPAPQLIFNHGRAGLGSQVEIEHFTDVMSSEGQSIQSPYSEMSVNNFNNFNSIVPPVSIPAPVASNLYPSYVQRAGTKKTYPYQLYDNTYHTANRASGSSPPPIRNWPKPITGTENVLSNTRAGASNMGIMPVIPPAAESPRPLSERALQKQRNPNPPSRSSSNGSINSQKSLSERRQRTPPAPPDLRKLASNKPVKAIPAQGSTENTTSRAHKEESSYRSRPTGPRTRTGSGSFSRPRPPPLDLTIKGSTPNSRR